MCIVNIHRTLHALVVDVQCEAYGNVYCAQYEHEAHNLTKFAIQTKRHCKEDFISELMLQPSVSTLESLL